MPESVLNQVDKRPGSRTAVILEALRFAFGMGDALAAAPVGSNADQIRETVESVIVPLVERLEKLSA